MKQKLITTFDEYATLILIDPLAIESVAGGVAANPSPSETNGYCHVDNVACIPPNIACMSNVVCG